MRQGESPTRLDSSCNSFLLLGQLLGLLLQLFNGLLRGLDLTAVCLDLEEYRY